MLRKLYYALPPAWRYLARYLYYLPSDLFSKTKNQLVPPRRLIYTGSGDFIRQGKAWLEFFIQEAKLTPSSVVMDIGSGIGRIAIPMMSFLKSRYEGFDAVRLGVDWCQKHITVINPNFTFQFVDLHNDLYKSEGRRADQFVFPYDDHCFDFICAISVFTHLQPEETENYLKQIKRLLKPGGMAILTFFLLDQETIKLMNTNKGGIQFNHQYPDYALMDLHVKSANVAYQRSYIYSLITSTGLKIIKEIKGSWCGREKSHYLDFQDILVIDCPETSGDD